MPKRRPLINNAEISTMRDGLAVPEQSEADHDLYRLDELNREEFLHAEHTLTSSEASKKIDKRNVKSKTYDDAEEKLLENIIFGDRGDILSRIDSNVQLVSLDNFADESSELKQSSQLFVIDNLGDNNVCSNDDSDNNSAGYVPRTQVNKLLESDEGDNDFESRTLETEQEQETRKPAWEDDDDKIKAGEVFDKKYPKRIQSDDHYKEYLESKFTSIFEPPSWATKALDRTKKRKKTSASSSDSDDFDEENEIAIERTARDHVQGKHRRQADDRQIDPNFLRLKKCTHLNDSSKIRTSLNCVQFHPNSTVALLGSQVGLVRLFQVDGKVNSIIQSIYFRGYRLCDAKFISHSGREEIIVGSDGSARDSIGFCFYYDMIAGKIVRIRLEKGDHKKYCLRGFEISPDSRYLAACDQNGHINLLTTASKEHVAELKMNGDVDCVAFTRDSNYLVTHGKGNACQAYVWDIRSAARCVNRFNDLGTIEATSLALSADLCAVGSNMGVVNLYRMDDIVKRTNPQPIRSVMNLTTAVDALRFNHDGQLLLISSSQKNDAIRFVNTTTANVYKNFPAYVGGSNNRTYGRIYGIDISPHSGYAAFATGNSTGHLFRINHYTSY